MLLGEMEDRAPHDEELALVFKVASSVPYEALVAAESVIAREHEDSYAALVIAKDALDLMIRDLEAVVGTRHPFRYGHNDLPRYRVQRERVEVLLAENRKAARSRAAQYRIVAASLSADQLAEALIAWRAQRRRRR